MEIRSLENTSFEKLFDAFEQAFAGYEIQINKTGHLAMLQRRGYDPKLSFAAFEGDKIVSFTCNGIGNYYGIPTAYDTGTGTLEGHRGQGLATKIFEYSIPFLKQAGIREYLLEVLQHNTGAVSVYSKLGFEVTREFYYFRPEKEKIANEARTTGIPCVVQPFDIGKYAVIPGFWDFRPSWQNSMESIGRASEGFTCLGAFTGNKLIGYIVFEPASGDITQIAVDRQYRRKGVGSLLFREMLGSGMPGTVKIINTGTGCGSLTAFLKAKNITPAGKQFEMIKKL